MKVYTQQDSLKHSCIINCKINNVIFNRLTYKSIYNKLYCIIGNSETIMYNTTLNIKPGNIKGKGFAYNERYKFSVQGASANRAIKEIMKQAHNNNISLDMTVRLKNNTLVRIIL